jgi:hypothetical protein
MIAINDTLISEDILEKEFVCNLNACKGECCVAGDSGAPLEFEEIDKLEEALDAVLPNLPKEGVDAIKEQGAFVIDFEGDYTTPLIDGGRCAYIYYDEGNAIAKCGVEKAYYDKKIDFIKPISCHLYPVRITKYKGYEAVNYDKWDICNAACDKGMKLGVPVYKFLKTPLIRKYGEDWYKQLELAATIK